MQKLLFGEYIYYVTIAAFVNCLLIVSLDGSYFTVSTLLILYAGMLVICTLQLIVANKFKNINGPLQIIATFLVSFATCFLILLLMFSVLAIPNYSIPKILLLSAISTPFLLSVIFFSRYQRQSMLVQQKEKQIANFTNTQKAREIEILKQQIDPHFIFNSFNTLSFLIGEDSSRAKAFSDKLANVYRYIIFNSNKNLIGLYEELEFSKNYSYLQEIRHSNEVHVEFSNFNRIENILILPVSIQVLLENAIKHNEFNEELPLVIHVQLHDNYITVENKKRLKVNNAPSSKIGLVNLRERCELIMHSELIVNDTSSAFVVKLPVHRH
jgi:sensor histidine kinase YesM